MYHPRLSRLNPRHLLKIFFQPSAPGCDDSEPGESDDGQENESGRDGGGQEEEHLELVVM